MANGERPVTAAELDAHLIPMREDISQLVNDQRGFAEFMTGAIISQKIQQRIIQSRHFWIGTAVALAAMLTTAIGILAAHVR